eukprot:c9129_g1_i1.p1 GENE.c9129_g1_i1~~c9129_g1_i1.p1  ORF type:complete len:269 (+),score=43.28 c9129_g1_i1:300-1106(+)
MSSQNMIPNLPHRMCKNSSKHLKPSKTKLRRRKSLLLKPKYPFVRFYVTNCNMLPLLLQVTKTTKTASADDSLVVPASTPLTPESFPGVFDVSDEVLVRQAAQDEQEKIRLANVEHVIVRCSKSLVAICHPMGALRIQSIRDCVIAVGPVAGAIYVMDCVNCQLMLSSHQVRIHDCIDCEFYLSAGSKPIIEHCTGLKFAPFRFQYPGLADHQKLVNHAPLENSWQEIQDFRWLRTTQSPNWSLLEESEWKTVVVNDSAEVSIQDSPQ